KLAQASSVYRSRESQSQAGLSEVKGALPSRSALVAYARYYRPTTTRATPEDRSSNLRAAYVAFIIKADGGGIACVALGDAGRIDAGVDAWRRELERESRGLSLASGSSEESYNEVASKLRAAVWDPIAPKVAGSRKVFVVPDAALNLVSLAALPVDAD